MEAEKHESRWEVEQLGGSTNEKLGCKVEVRVGIKWQFIGKQKWTENREERRLRRKAQQGRNKECKTKACNERKTWQWPFYNHFKCLGAENGLLSGNLFLTLFIMLWVLIRPH